MNLTRLALKRPVSMILIILALAVFGISSIPEFKMQLIPDMDMPMLIVMTAYPGADPESVDELVTSVVEDAGSVLSGIESVTSQSSANVSTVLFSYEYGVDIDECYADLRTALDTASLLMPADAESPVVIELNMNQTADMTLSAVTDENMDLRKKIEDGLVPELESITDVAQVSVSGGAQDYIRVLLNEDAMRQYGLTISNVASYLAEPGPHRDGHGRGGAAVGYRGGFPGQGGVRHHQPQRGPGQRQHQRSEKAERQRGAGDGLRGGGHGGVFRGKSGREPGDGV